MDAKEFASFRKSLGLSQAELGKRLGLDAMTISRYETGKSRIAPWLKLAVDSLLREAGAGSDTLLTRKIRNAKCYSDLAEIKASMGLDEPELPFTRSEIEAIIRELFDESIGLRFADSAEEFEQPPHGSRARAQQYVDEWLALHFPASAKIGHFTEELIQDFFFELIYIFSINSFTGKHSSSLLEEDSRQDPYSKTRKFLDRRYQPFRKAPLNQAELGRQLAEFISTAKALENACCGIGKIDRVNELRDLERGYSALIRRLYRMSADINAAMKDGQETFEISAEIMRQIGEMFEHAGSAAIALKDIARELESKAFDIRWQAYSNMNKGVDV